jgi:hypothetical protein
MTVTQLIRQLEKLKEKHGNLKVVVNKEELDDGNGCWAVCHISTVVAEWVYLSDDDGGVAYTKAGRERGTTQIILGNK